MVFEFCGMGGSASGGILGVNILRTGPYEILSAMRRPGTPNISFNEGVQGTLGVVNPGSTEGSPMGFACADRNDVAKLMQRKARQGALEIHSGASSRRFRCSHSVRSRLIVYPWCKCSVPCLPNLIRWFASVVGCRANLVAALPSGQ